MLDEDVAPLAIQSQEATAELGMSRASRAAMHLIVPVWGGSHVTTFLDLVLPLYLAPGNIPAAASEREVRLRIYTRERDTGLFTASATFQRARDQAEIDFVYMDDKIEIPHTTMSWCHKDALRFAGGRNAMTILLTADTIFADATLLRLGQLSDDGKRAVLVAGPRVIEEEMLEELARHWRKTEQTSITPEAFTALCLRHLHPISLSNTWNSNGYLNTHPSHLYWAVENEGFLAHCFHLHPLMVRPRLAEVKFDKTIDDDYMISAGFTSEEIHIVSDNLDLAVFSITGRQIIIGNDRQLVPSAAYVAYWARLFTHPYHRRLARAPICFYTQKTSPSWLRYEHEAQQVLDDIDHLLADGNFRLFFRRPDLFFDKILFDNQTLSFHPMREVLRSHIDELASASARQWHLALVRILLSREAFLLPSAISSWLRSTRYMRAIKRFAYTRYIDVARMYPKIDRLVFGRPPAVRLCHRQWLLLNSYALTLRKVASSAVGRTAVVYDKASVDHFAIEYLSTLFRKRAGDGSSPTLELFDDGVASGPLNCYDTLVYIETTGVGENMHRDLRGLATALCPGGCIHKIAVAGQGKKRALTINEDLGDLKLEVAASIGGWASRAVLRGLARLSALLRRTGRLEPFCALAIAPLGALLVPVLNCLARFIDASRRPAAPLLSYMVLSKR
jgi:hypothetical protein